MSRFILLLCKTVVGLPPPPPGDFYWIESTSGKQMITNSGKYYIFVG